MSHCYLIANFGGPRSLKEVEPFLCELLTDKEVVRTKWPQFVHNLLFRKIARKRAIKVKEDYRLIGGKSPIFFDTEWVASTLEDKLETPVLTFHRYLPSTHRASLEALENAEHSEIRVFPMFPQFTFATTGSIARFFKQNLSAKTLSKLKWVRSYPEHPAFVLLVRKMIQEFLKEKNIDEEDTFLLFSAHGLPQIFIDEGDSYENECRRSFNEMMQCFPKAKGLLAFQSKFGPGEWLKPYTDEVCKNIKAYLSEKRKILFIPISFTSDHIETLFEIEKLYLPLLTDQGFLAFRLPAMNRRLDWVEAIEEILNDKNLVANDTLIRQL